MIYTVTFSPALDYVVSLASFQEGVINRTTSEVVSAGGKGINVSKVLANLNTRSVAVGFLAGFTGKYIEQNLRSSGIETNFIYLEGSSRINVKITSPKETAINGMGPYINRFDIDNLFSLLGSCHDGDIVVFSGKMPSILDSELLRKHLGILKNKGVDFAFDTEDKILLDALEFNPLLVKPNVNELKLLFDVDIDTEEDLIACARKLKDGGARNVIVTMGGKGAYLLTDVSDSTYLIKAPQGETKNTVGAGDSLLAGFLHRYELTHDPIDSTIYGIACGSASAFSENLATLDEVEALYAELKH
ncbi:MAG: 1-phosphofructokinase [Bacilli bacterium]|nr:1-phosphofructokinase [Bacilli bacterium]